jgi:hypothetical protein
MAMFDKDGSGTLDKEEMKAFKLHWKNLTSGSSRPLSGADTSAVGNSDANSTAVAKQGDGAVSSSASGCGGPGGFCCCRCGCPKGGRCSLPHLPSHHVNYEHPHILVSAMGERRAIERVELTLLRLESIMKDTGRDEEPDALLTFAEDDDSARVASTGVVQGSGGAATRSIKRNSVAPL